MRSRSVRKGSSSDNVAKIAPNKTNIKPKSFIQNMSGHNISAIKRIRVAIQKQVVLTIMKIRGNFGIFLGTVLSHVRKAPARALNPRSTFTVEISIC